MNKPWYYINFPSDLYFNGKTTRFLRIAIPHDIYLLSNTEYYISLIPVCLSDEETSSQYYVNGINVQEYYKDIWTDYQTNTNTINWYGNIGSSIISGTSFKYPALNKWQKLDLSLASQTIEFRIDYEGEKNELIKFVLFISNISPENFPENLPNISAASAGYGAKSPDILEQLTDDQRIDYVELDILGIAQTKLESKENISIYNTNENILLDDNCSHMLLRTNPLLSGNVKLTTDNDGSIWLNSIDANDDLANVKYKRFKLSPLSQYAVDLYKFFDNGKTEADSVFYLKQSDTEYLYAKNEFYLQYDNFYGAGAHRRTNKFYDEEFAYFAPLWLKKQLPDYFIICKIDHPLSEISYNGNFTDDALIKDCLKNATIIKTFDLRQGSKIGDYLRNIVEGERFKEQPLFVSFEQDEMSWWSGASYKDATVSQKGENLYNIFSKDRTIKDFEKYITEGFKRNGVICQNLINMEFLFNDDESDEYSINRYFGFYANTIELDTFKLNDLILSKINEQQPIARYNVDAVPYATEMFIQKNENGIVLPVTYSDKNKVTIDGDYNDIFRSFVEDKNKFIVVKNRTSDLLRVKNLEYNVVDDIDYREIRLYNKEADINQFVGLDKFSSQLRAELLNESSAQMVLHLYDTIDNNYVLEPGEKLSILWEDSDKFHRWEMIANETGVQPGDAWNYPVYNYDTYTYQNTFNPKGTPEKVAQAIANCINMFNTIHFEAVAIENKVYIISLKKSDTENKFKIRRDLNDESEILNVRLYDRKPIIETGQTFFEYNFIGGNTRNRDRAKVDIIKGTNVEIDDWFQCQRQRYSKVKDFSIGESLTNSTITSITSVPYIDEPIRDIYGNLIGFKDIDKYVVIELSDEDEFYMSNEKYITAYKVYKPEISLLSIFPIKDFDFDFFNSDYAYCPVAELFKYFETYEIATNEYVELPLNEFFRVVSGSGNLEACYKDEWINICSFGTGTDANLNITNTFNTVPTILDYDKRQYSLSFRNYNEIGTFDKFRIVCTSNENLKVVKALYSQNSLNRKSTLRNEELYQRLSLENIDYKITDFPGFAGLKVPNINSDELLKLKNSESFERFTKPLLKTEYDYLMENDNKDFVLLSRVVPFINKWVNKGTDVHDNKYRLNISDAFRTNNMSPTDDIICSPESYTHEWYYLDRHPQNYPIEFLTNSRGYMFAKLDDIPYPKIDKKSILFSDLHPDYKKYMGKTWKELLYFAGENDPDFFIKYFSEGTPCSTTSDNINKSKSERFVITEFIDSLYQANCIFHGARIQINELNNLNEIVTNSDKYKNYKFAAILTLQERKLFDYTEPIGIEIIDNQQHKCITFIITAYIQDYKLKNNLDYTSLYSLGDGQKNDSVFKDNYEKFSEINYNDIKYNNKKSLSNNEYTVITDYDDVPISTLLKQYGRTSFEISRQRLEKNDLYIDEIFRCDPGDLTSPFALLYMNNNYCSNTVSFEGFLSQIESSTRNDSNLQYSYPTYVMNLHNVRDVYMKIIDAAYVIRLNPFYPNGIRYDIDENLLRITDNDDGDNLQNTNIVSITPYMLGNNYVTSKTKIYVNINGENDINNVIKDTYFLNGGKNANSEWLNMLSFNNIKKLVNNKNKLVQYISVGTDGIKNKNKFCLKFLDSSEIIKNNILTSIVDKNIPSELKTRQVIGFDLETNKTFSKLLRYNGNYEPKTRDIIKFNLNELFKYTEFFESDFLLLNSTINTDILNSGVIKNLSINKINLNETPIITSDRTYYNKYPITGKIAIDNKDQNIFVSTWDNNFYRNYNILDTYTPESGLVEMKEFKTFFGSKIMNVKKQYKLDAFLNSEYIQKILNPVGANVRTVKTTNNKKSADDGRLRLEIILNIKSRLIRYMFSDGISKEFDWIRKNINTIFSEKTQSEINDIIEKYIEQNIIELYEINDIKIYTKTEERKNDISINDSIITPDRYYDLQLNLSEDKIMKQGFKLNKSFSFEHDIKNMLNAIITVDLDTNLFQTIAAVVTTKRL